MPDLTPAPVSTATSAPSAIMLLDGVGRGGDARLFFSLPRNGDAHRSLLPLIRHEAANASATSDTRAT